MARGSHSFSFETGGVGLSPILNPIACELFSLSRINLMGSRQSLFARDPSTRRSSITQTVTKKSGIDIRFLFQNRVRGAGQPWQDWSALLMERLHVFKLRTTSPDSACNATMLSATINRKYLRFGSGEAYKPPSHYLSPVFTRD